MFINLSEIALIGLIAVLVIKPERLPEIALTAGRLVKWTEQRLAKLKQDLFK